MIWEVHLSLVSDRGWADICNCSFILKDHAPMHEVNWRRVDVIVKSG